MNKKIAGVLLGVLLVGIVSAGLITSWGTISGNVIIEEPTFYLSAEHLVDENDTKYWALGIDDYVDRTDPVSFTGGDTKWFVSPSLGVESFYATNYKIILEAESTNESGKLDIAVYIVDGEFPFSKHTPALCEKSIDVFNYRDDYEINCEIPELSLYESDRIALILSDGANSITYKIYLKGISKIEVTAA